MKLKVGQVITETKNLVNQPDQLIQYKIIELLGEGGFATCFKVENLSNGVHSACKVIDRVSLT